MAVGGLSHGRHRPAGCDDEGMTSGHEPLGSLLADKRAALETELAGLEGGSQPVEIAGSISFGKRVGDGTSVAVERLSQVAAHDRLQQTLADVTRAQAKLAEGSYGRCDRCGEVIPAARLEALPWAVRCVACAGMG
jgi:DnaK suppressor protein